MAAVRTTAQHDLSDASNFATQEIVHWVEYLMATIACQEKAIRHIREQLPTAKTHCLVQTLAHLERSIAVNKCTLQQFEVGAQMISGHLKTVDSIKPPIHRRSSDMNC